MIFTAYFVKIFLQNPAKHHCYWWIQMLCMHSCFLKRCKDQGNNIKKKKSVMKWQLHVGLLVAKVIKFLKLSLCTCEDKTVFLLYTNSCHQENIESTFQNGQFTIWCEFQLWLQLLLLAVTSVWQTCHHTSLALQQHQCFFACVPDMGYWVIRTQF